MPSIWTNIKFSGLVKSLTYNSDFTFHHTGKLLDLCLLKEFIYSKSNVFEMIVYRNHCEKRRKCLQPEFSSSPSMCSDCFFPRVVIDRDCFLKDLIL